MVTGLHVLLAEQGRPVTEYALLQILREEGWPFFEQVDLSDELQMFRAHFLLFHLLYLLKEELETKTTGSLHIHCLNIALLPPQKVKPSQQRVPAPRDGLRDYYMDLAAYEKTTREEVRAMIEGFWKRFKAQDHRAEALDVLKLPAGADKITIKTRYRQLVKQHHPDVGGNSAKFRRIQWAMDVLQQS